MTLGGGQNSMRNINISGNLAGHISWKIVWDLRGKHACIGPPNALRFGMGSVGRGTILRLADGPTLVKGPRRASDSVAELVASVFAEKTHKTLLFR